MHTPSDTRPIEVRAEAAIAANDLDALRTLPIEASLHHPNRAWATSLCLALASHDDPNVRGNGVLGLGHLARRFLELDARAREVVERALVDDDPYVVNHARSAAYDIRQFLAWTFSVGTSVDRVVWEGSAAGRTWRARHVDWTAPGDEREVWALTIETTDALPRDVIDSWWMPAERMLGGHLHGWSKPAIGNLKRTLAQAASPDAKAGARRTRSR